MEGRRRRAEERERGIEEETGGNGDRGDEKQEPHLPLHKGCSSDFLRHREPSRTPDLREQIWATAALQAEATGTEFRPLTH